MNKIENGERNLGVVLARSLLGALNFIAVEIVAERANLQRHLAIGPVAKHKLKRAAIVVRHAMRALTLPAPVWQRIGSDANIAVPAIGWFERGGCMSKLYR